MPTPGRHQGLTSPFDDAAKLMRKIYKPLNSSDMFVNALTRRDPAIRPKEVLRATTSHVQKAATTASG